MKTKEKESQNQAKRVIEVKKSKDSPNKLNILWSEAVVELKTRKFESEAEMLETVVDLIAKKVSGGSELKSFLETTLSTDPKAMEILRKELL